MAASRKLYVATAACLAVAKPSYDSSSDCNRAALRAWEHAVMAISDAFKADNPAFDRERFAEAAGYDA